MYLFFRTLSAVIAALLAIHMIGCTSSNDDAETSGAVLVSTTPPTDAKYAGETVNETDVQIELTKSPFKVTDANFTKLVMESELPVVVYFWADWCPPCKWMAPIIEEIGSENRATFLIAKLDADRNLETPRKYRIEAIPTFIVFRDGKIIGRFVGGMQKAPLLQRILQAINTQGN